MRAIVGQATSEEEEPVDMEVDTGPTMSSSSSSGVPPHYPPVPPLPVSSDDAHADDTSRRFKRRSWLCGLSRALASADLLSTIDCSSIRTALSEIKPETTDDDIFRHALLCFLRLYYSMEEACQITVPMDEIEKLSPKSLVGVASSTLSENHRLGPFLDHAIMCMQQEYCPSKEDDTQQRSGIFVHDSTGQTYTTPKTQKEAPANQEEMNKAMAELCPNL